jgi:aminoglycoside phosphotransferase (APT) family kinase protein
VRLNPPDLPALEKFIAAAGGAKGATITAFTPLVDGAIQENWLLDVDIDGGFLSGRLEAVLRTDAAAVIGESHSRAHEFALLKAAFAAGVRVPEPLVLCVEPSVLGGTFFIMRRLSGVGAGHRVVRDMSLGGDRRDLLKSLAYELAKIHAITPPQAGLEFLPVPEPTPALYSVNKYHAFFDGHETPRPALEWGLRWLRRNAPAAADIVLCHGDFRTGNYLIDETGLSGILDWEFSAWGDFHSDIGWFCAKCWRAGAWDREAGGIGGREDFYLPYEQATGRVIDRDRVAYWEVMAHVRWAVIAIEQADRYLKGGEDSLELALTAHVVPELELEVLRLTGEG